MQFYRNESPTDEIKWVKQLRKIQKYLTVMDKNKYIFPKYSDTLLAVSNFLKDHFEGDVNSTITSNYSLFMDNKSEISGRIISTNTTTQVSEVIKEFPLLENSSAIGNYKQLTLSELKTQQSPSRTQLKQAAANTSGKPVRNHTSGGLGSSSKKKSAVEKFIEYQQIMSEKSDNMTPFQDNSPINQPSNEQQQQVVRNVISNKQFNVNIKPVGGPRTKLSQFLHDTDNNIQERFEEEDDQVHSLNDSNAQLNGRSQINSQPPSDKQQEQIINGQIIKKPMTENDFNTNIQQKFGGESELGGDLSLSRFKSNPSSQGNTSNINKKTAGYNQTQNQARKFSSQPRNGGRRIILNQLTRDLFPNIQSKTKSILTKQNLKIPKMTFRSTSKNSLKSLSVSSSKSRKWKRKEYNYHNNLLINAMQEDKLTKNKYLKNYLRLDEQSNRQDSSNNYPGVGRQNSNQKQLDIQSNNASTQPMFEVSQLIQRNPDEQIYVIQSTRNRRKKTKSNAGMIHNAFVSPLRGATAAVPHNKRDMSSSPYLPKKKSENMQIQRDLSEDEIMNKMISYNGMKSIEDTNERKFIEIIEMERAQFKKKEYASKEIISEISKRLKMNQKRIGEESKVALEIKKKHDQMKKKLEKAGKEKSDTVNQLKSLFVLFTQQRKALEVSIGKTKKLEDDNQRLEQRNRNLEEQHKSFAKKIEQLEGDREILLNKHRRDKEQLESDTEEKRQLLKRYENEFRDISNSKLVMKKQMEEYENKIKKLIKEFEDESKKHIREINEVHEYYRGYKSSSQELEQRIKHYKSDYEKALQGEREAKKEVVRLTLENDELNEKARYMEHRYHSLVQKLGASQEDLQAIEEELMADVMVSGSSAPDQEAQYIQQKQTKGVSQGRSAQKDKQSNNRGQDPFQKVVDVRQAKQQEALKVEDYESDRQVSGNDRRTESRLERRRNDDVGVDSYEYYGDHPDEDDEDEQQNQVVQQKTGQNNRQQNQQQQQQQQQKPQNLSKKSKPDGVVSGEQIIEQSESKRKAQSKGVSAGGQGTANKKNTQIEVLDDERPMEQYYGAQGGDQDNDSESGDLLKKLIENLQGNPQLQNVYIKEIFKLSKINCEEDLHNYKNLLNSMAALFYTNHRMNHVGLLFQYWREASLYVQQQRDAQLQQQQQQQQQQQKSSKQQQQTVSQQNKQQQNQSSSSKKPKQAIPPIQIDTELANQEVFKNYNQQNVDLSHDDIPSEIEQDSNLKNNMIHIEGDLLDDEMDEDKRMDIQVKNFLDELKKLGPISKQILNYSYPPLLYQRGDDDEDEEEEDEDNHDGLPDFAAELDDDEDKDIQELIQGGNKKNQKPGQKQDEIYNKLKKVVNDKEAQQYYEQVDEDGNVYLVEGNDQEDEDDVYGQEDDMDDEEFMQMMEQEAAAGRLRGGIGGGGGQGGVDGQQQNSTIINSSQNTSLEDNFIVE